MMQFLFLCTSLSLHFEQSSGSLPSSFHIAIYTDSCLVKPYPPFASREPTRSKVGQKGHGSSLVGSCVFPFYGITSSQFVSLVAFSMVWRLMDISVGFLDDYCGVGNVLPCHVQLLLFDNSLIFFPIPKPF